MTLLTYWHHRMIDTTYILTSQNDWHYLHGDITEWLTLLTYWHHRNIDSKNNLHQLKLKTLKFTVLWQWQVVYNNESEKKMTFTSNDVILICYSMYIWKTALIEYMKKEKWKNDINFNMVCT